MLLLSPKEERFLLIFLPLFLLGCGWYYVRKAGGRAERPLWQLEQREIYQSFQQHPAKQQPAAKTLPAPKQRLLSGKININTATEGEITRLPRIGPVMAKRIIDYRKQQGPFKTAADLLQVKGIGEKTIARIQEQITFE